MITCEQLNVLLAHVFLGGEHILVIHPECNIRPLLGGELFQVGDFSVVEHLFNCFRLRGHNVLDLVMMGHLCAMTGKHSATFMRGSGSGLSDYLVEDLLRNG